MITARLHALFLTLWLRLTLCRLPRARARSDRGDVPGWVMITVMTAAIVAAIWTVAKDDLVRLFRDAIGQVESRP